MICVVIYDLFVLWHFILQATFDCLMKTYGFLTPEFWKETRFSKSPFQEYTDLLAKPTAKALILEEERVEAWSWSFSFVGWSWCVLNILGTSNYNFCCVCCFLPYRRTIYSFLHFVFQLCCLDIYLSFDY